MSLIERAAARLRQGETGSPGEENAAAGHRGTEPRTAIEALADRMAAEDSPSSAAPSTAAPVAAAPAPAAASTAPEVEIAPGTAPEPVRIQLEALRARGMAVPTGAPTPAAHEFRIIKRPLLANAFGRSGQQPARNGKRIMVTSALPGEGKSFCAINLALSIAAERDHGVILVDADVSRPSIPRELGFEPRAGLMDWLIDGAPDLSRLVLPTNIDTLSILPAGRHDEHATELLASEAMGRLLAQLSERYPDCIVIFDSPPLLATTEARVLASYMGQIVMVVEAGKTPRDAVTQALSTIESSEIVGLILNKAHKIESSGYYGGYGYASA
ncbi:MAG: XrtA-associated tyrosine autokinase [Anaerolineae bacterium]|nr:XrtA-associated tyrosine autokinase [Anaerolineae bacterium]